MTDEVIRLDAVGKRYTKYDDEPLLVTGVLRMRHRTRRSALWAVRDVDLGVDAGECLGVIGRNGSGKSTLLQMLAGVTAPTAGRVEVRGRVAPLVSVGVGFHPELTGRENVYVNATILGLTKAEIDRRFDAIVDFSGIEPFIDTPVKFYSSGMYVRIGFAVAVEAAPDILLIDEVLAVGDIGFQLKCFRRMADIRASGTTIVVVSHNLNAVRQLCDRAVVLHDGEKRHDGDVDQAIGLYHALLGEAAEPESVSAADERVEAGVAAIESVELLDDAGRALTHITSGNEVTVTVRTRFARDVDRPAFGIAVISPAGVNVYSESTAARRLPAVHSGETVTCRVRLRLPLATGSYTLRAGVYRVLDEFAATARLDEAMPVPFFVAGRTGMGGTVDLAGEFTVEPG